MNNNNKILIYCRAAVRAKIKRACAQKHSSTFYFADSVSHPNRENWVTPTLYTRLRIVVVVVVFAVDIEHNFTKSMYINETQWTSKLQHDINRPKFVLDISGVLRLSFNSLFSRIHSVFYCLQD